MNVSQFEKFCQRGVTQVLKAMAMDHIRPIVEVYQDEGDECAGANICPSRYSRNPTIVFNYCQFTTEEELRNTIVHEVCHCFHSRTSALRTHVLSVSDESEHQLIDENFYEAHEDIVENLLQMFLRGSPEKVSQYLSGKR